MTKKISMALVTTGLLLFSGCATDSAVTQRGANEARLSSGTTLAYAYMKDGEKVVKISTKRDGKVDDDIEIIRITYGGFYPDYDMSREVEKGEKSPGCFVKMDDNDKNKKFCESRYTGRQALYTGIASIVNAAATVTTVGLNVASGAISDPKFFQREQFLEIVKGNDLPKYRKVLLELYKSAESKERSIDGLYSEAYNNYRKGAGNIRISYNIVDRSGMVPPSTLKEITLPVEIVPDAPERKSFDYKKEINFEASAADIEKVLAETGEKIENRFKKDYEEYEKYIKEGFDHYALRGPSEYDYRHNDRVTYHLKTDIPKSVEYRPDTAKNLTIGATVEYADLKGMIPSKFLLEDNKNLKMEFHPDSNMIITAIGTNKTKSFLTISSITAYYGSGANTLSGLNREIAPETTTLAKNSRYDLFSDKMKKSSIFSKMTAAKAKKIVIDSGYAVKYRIMNTNLDHTIYDTEKYSLYDIYLQYI